MATGEGKVEIVGLADFLRDLKQMPEDVQTAFAHDMKDVAEIVAQAAARKVNSRTGDAIASIVSKGTTTGASVGEGGRQAPYMNWLDFGSRTPQTGQPRSVGPWAHSGKGPTGGRFIYPAIDDKRSEIMRAAEAAVDKAAAKAEFH